MRTISLHSLPNNMVYRTAHDYAKKIADEEQIEREQKKRKESLDSHAGNRTPATAVRAPDPNH